MIEKRTYDMEVTDMNLDRRIPWIQSIWGYIHLIETKYVKQHNYSRGFLLKEVDDKLREIGIEAHWAPTLKSGTEINFMDTYTESVAYLKEIQIIDEKKFTLFLLRK